MPDLHARAAAIVASLQQRDGRPIDDASDLDAIQLLIEHGNVSEVDGKLYLRHSELPARTEADAPEPPPPPPAPQQPKAKKQKQPARLGWNAETRARVEAEREAILMTLEARGASMRVREIAEATGITETAVRQRLAGLQKAGKARQIGHGDWAACAEMAAPATPPLVDLGRGLMVSPVALGSQVELTADDALHPVLAELLRTLPPAMSEFTGKARFIAAWAACLDVVYPDEDEAE